MDQVKIGKFISECRKAQGLTQAQLAEKLNITDRAVSKWERGLSLPDSAIMMELCNLLDITVNDLLSGEKVSMEEKNKQNEQLVLDMAKELERKNKIIWKTMWILMIVSITALFAGLFIAAFLIPEGVWQLVVILVDCIVFLIPCFFALKLEVKVGSYECKKCGCKIVPTYSEALNAMHMGTTRYLKCPSCGKRTWCRKTLKK